MTVPRRQWVKRLGMVVTVGVVLCLFFGWLYMGPSWPGVLAAVLALFSIGWFLADFGHDLETPAWETHQLQHVRRTPIDGRMGYLRRVISRACEPPPEGAPTSQGAAALQEILQEAAAGRLRARFPGGAHDPPVDVIRREQHHLDPALAGYLLGPPPRALEETQLDALLTRIENL